MSNHSVIEHRANYHFAKIEEDYIAICLTGEASPHCKALILAILESWTNSKRDNGEEPVVYMTYPQWVQAMYWQHGRNVIIESLEELEKQGLITRKPHRFKGKDTFAYVLNIQAVQERIKQLPEKANGEYLPRFNLNAFKSKRVYNQTRPKSNGSAVYNQTPDAFNNIPFIDSDTQIHHLDSQEEREAFAFAHDARAFSESENDSYRHDHTRKEDAWNCHNWCAAHGKSCADYQVAIDTGFRDEPTDKFPVVKPPVAIAPTLGGAASPQAAAVRQSYTTSKSRVASSAPTATAEGHEQPDGAATGRTSSEPRASEQTPLSLIVPAEASELPTVRSPGSSAKPAAPGVVTQASILADWEAVQGCPQAWTERHYKAARQGVRASPTREELAGCRTWLPTTDNPKTLWYHSHGVELWDVIEKLNAYRSHLALSIEPAPLADMPKPKPMDAYTAAMLDPERTERNLEKLRQRRLAREAAQQQGGAT